MAVAGISCMRNDSIHTASSVDMYIYVFHCLPMVYGYSAKSHKLVILYNRCFLQKAEGASRGSQSGTLVTDREVRVSRHRRCQPISLNF